ncbi:aromatic-ring-hydroxylating dioxygenase subunit beta [Undibacterium arcticum]|uniref:Aromatic-ring-hydroxylating dioxygenase subunit beta n=2 Tax=Undibacterium arcticum TaxID=1762892 RepID=A0ABV7EUE8_9BURK
MDTTTRFAIQDLYADYTRCVDDSCYEEWPEFFTDECLYRNVSRENFEAGLPMSALALESKAMLKDRVYGVTQTIFHAPYFQRHIVGIPKIISESDGVIVSEANYLVIRTKLDSFSEVFNAGRYIDTIVRENGRLKFRQRICVFDSELVPNSIIYPI